MIREPSRLRSHGKDTVWAGVGSGASYRAPETGGSDGVRGATKTRAAGVWCRLQSLRHRNRRTRARVGRVFVRLPRGRAHYDGAEVDARARAFDRKRAIQRRDDAFWWQRHPHEEVGTRCGRSTRPFHRSKLCLAHSEFPKTDTGFPARSAAVDRRSSPSRERPALRSARPTAGPVPATLRQPAGGRGQAQSARRCTVFACPSHDFRSSVSLVRLWSAKRRSACVDRVFCVVASHELASADVGGLLCAACACPQPPAGTCCLAGCG